MSAEDFDSLDIHETADGESRADEPASLGDQATVGNEGASTAGDEGEDSDSTEELDSVVPLVDLGKHFEIVEVLGRGGMGEVFKARDRALGRLVAIKRIRGRDGSVVRSRGALERFKREARSVAALEHSNIVRLWSFCRDANGPYLVMEFVDGPTLAEQLKQGPLNLDLAIDWTCGLCDALEVAHAKGIFHRDVKPLNVLLAGGTTPKLSDFGLARRRTEDLQLSGEGASLGTLAYMPPEQEHDASSVDARSDLYSLGATLYEMVTGSSPRRLRLSLVPDALRDVLTKVLEENPADRFQTAAEFRKALREVASAARSEAPAPDLPGTGVCPACQAENPVTNRFCRECAASLETTCLACEAEMPMWENVCQACGSKQVDLLNAYREQLREWMHEAQRLREAAQFDEALGVAGRAAALTHSRLAPDVAWAAEFQAEVRQQRVETLDTFDRGMAAARRLVDEQDEAGALRLLDTLPKAVCEQDERRRTEFETLREHARACAEELPGLMRQIRASVGEKSYDGLLPIVERYLTLRPGEERVTKLRAQLLARVKRKRQQRIDSARAAFEAGRIQRGLATLETFSVEERDSEIRELIDWARAQLAGVKRERQKKIDTARTALESGRIQGALATLETFPEDERDSEITELIAWAKAQLSTPEVEFAAANPSTAEEQQFSIDDANSQIRQGDTSGTQSTANQQDAEDVEQPEDYPEGCLMVLAGFMILLAILVGFQYGRWFVLGPAHVTLQAVFWITVVVGRYMRGKKSA